MEDEAPGFVERGGADSALGDIDMKRSTGPRRRRYAGALTAVLAVLGSVVATQHVAASNTSDPAITAYAVSRPGAGDPLINDVMPGPEGWLWFTWATGDGSLSGIGTVYSNGSVGTFTTPNGWTVNHMTTGNGYVWAAESHAGAQYIAQWAPSSAIVATFPVTGAAALQGITWGPDGALWFAAGSSADSCGMQGGFIGRMTTSGDVTTFALPAGGGGDNGAEDIAPGPDGALWFDLPKEASIGRITTSGTINVYTLPGAQSQCDFASDQELAAGPDGAEWVGGRGSGGVHRVSSDGSITTYAVSNDLFSLMAGSDGNLWYTTAFVAASVNRLTTSGRLMGTWTLPPAYPAAAPLITLGADGHPWMAMQGVIERLDPNVPPSGATASAAPTPAPGSSPPAGSGSTTGVSSTPAPFDPESPTPSASAPALASVHARPASGSGLGIVLGSIAAVVLLASGVAAIVIQRRQSGATKSP